MNNPAPTRNKQPFWLWQNWLWRYISQSPDLAAGCRCQHHFNGITCPVENIWNEGTHPTDSVLHQLSQNQAGHSSSSYV